MTTDTDRSKPAGEAEREGREECIGSVGPWAAALVMHQPTTPAADDDDDDDDQLGVCNTLGVYSFAQLNACCAPLLPAMRLHCHTHPHPAT